jgi:hypothetical protein
MSTFEGFLLGFRGREVRARPLQIGPAAAEYDAGGLTAAKTAGRKRGCFLGEWAEKVPRCEVARVPGVEEEE